MLPASVLRLGWTQYIVSAASICAKVRLDTVYTQLVLPASVLRLGRTQYIVSAASICAKVRHDTVHS